MSKALVNLAGLLACDMLMSIDWFACSVLFFCCKTVWSCLSIPCGFRIHLHTLSKHGFEICPLDYKGDERTKEDCQKWCCSDFVKSFSFSSIFSSVTHPIVFPLLQQITVWGSLVDSLCPCTQFSLKRIWLTVAKWRSIAKRYSDTSILN